MAGHLEFEFGISDRKKFNDAARALGRVERSTPRDVDKLISKAQKANAKEAAAKVRSMPAKGDEGSTGLRKDVARGVGTMPIDGGTRIYTSMPEEDEAIIPLGLDTDKGWRHPVFGKDRWVTQRGDFSWFMETMKESFKTLPPQVHDILEDGADHIDNAAH